MSSDQQPESPQKKSAPAKSRVWLRRGLELLLFIILIIGIRTWQQRDIVKGVAPSLSAIQLDGKSYVLPLKPTQPVLVHFWATWCPICRAEEGSIDSLAHDDPNVITVAMQSGDNSVVKQYMHEQNVTFPVINDADNRISAAWGVQGVPASFIVDRNGQIRFVEIGYTTELGLRFRLWLARF